MDRIIKQYMRRFIILLLVVIGTVNSHAQNNIGIKYFGLSIHPKGEHDNAFLMPRKLDPNGYFVLNVGAQINYEHFIYKDIVSIKIIQALYADCASRLGGFSHIGLRGRFFKINRHVLSGGIGPTLVFRRNWLELVGYQNPERFKGDIGQKWQHLFLWYGGEFEYKYYLNQNTTFALSFVPGYPDLMSLSLGLHYDI